MYDSCDIWIEYLEQDLKSGKHLYDDIHPAFWQKTARHCCWRMVFEECLPSKLALTSHWKSWPIIADIRGHYNEQLRDYIAEETQKRDKLVEVDIKFLYDRIRMYLNVIPIEAPMSWLLKYTVCSWWDNFGSVIMRHWRNDNLLQNMGDSSICKPECLFKSVVIFAKMQIRQSNML